jgi:hypothetical protein
MLLSFTLLFEISRQSTENIVFLFVLCGCETRAIYSEKKRNTSDVPLPLMVHKAIFMFAYGSKASFVLTVAHMLVPSYYRLASCVPVEASLRLSIEAELETRTP